MRARQVARPDRPAPSAVWSFRRISRDCASFSGGLAMAGVSFRLRFSITRLRCSVVILLRSMTIILLSCSIFILLCRERTVWPAWKGGLSLHR